MKVQSNSDTSAPPGGWTPDRLKSLRIPELIELYKTLSPPSLIEMEGEFRGEYLGSRRFFSDSLWRLCAFSNVTSGIWQGKSFRPASNDEGYGCNTLNRFGKIIRKWPMRTSIALSRYDNKEVFYLDYTYYNSAARFVSMQDEVRRVSDSLFLGVGHWRLPFITRLASVWFTLSGPIGPFNDEGVVYKKH